MRTPGVVIAAPKSGSGKTLITMALMKALKQRQFSVRAFKCGPDYIDPMFHREVLRVPSKNLDTFFVDEKMLRTLYTESISETLMTSKLGGRGSVGGTSGAWKGIEGRGEVTSDKPIAVVEGVMGLYDGIGISDEASTYEVARALRIPIILVVDAKGMSRSVVAEIAGFLRYDKEGLVRGVILNRTNEKIYKLVAPIIESELNIYALGYYKNNKDLTIKSRHLGLIMPNEVENLRQKVTTAAASLEKTVDVDNIIRIASTAERLPDHQLMIERIVRQGVKSPVIAVARDKAFSFIYEDNLKVLREAGAEIRFFSPLRDDRIPEGSSGIILYGGYPELYLIELSNNTSMLNSVREAILDGMPTIAECGGYLYLHEKVYDQHDRGFNMCGVVKGSCRDTGKLSHFGYVTVREKEARFLPKDTVIRAHEFHHYNSTANDTACIIEKAGSDESWEGIMSGPGSFVGFPHFFYPSNPEFAYHFIKAVIKYRDKNNQ